MKKFGCAFKGVGIAFVTDNSFKTHLAASILATVLGLFLGLSSLEWALLVFAIGLVFVAELFNTAIEHLVRMFTQDYHELAERLLDISAGAVLVATFASISIGLIIFGSKLLALLS